MKREEFEELYNSDNINVKQNAIKLYLQKNNKFKDYHYLYEKIYSQLPEEQFITKIAILSSFTIDPIKEILAVETSKYGIKCDIYISGYNQYDIEILNVSSEFHKFDAEIILMIIRIEDLFPEFISNFLRIRPDDLEKQIKNIVDKFNSLFSSIRKNSNAKIFITNFLYPQFIANGIYDFQNLNGQISWIDKINHNLIELVNQYTDIFIFDLRYYVYMFGLNNVFDQKMWFYAKNPFKSQFIVELARNYSQFIKSVSGKRKKCLVLDLDNTLWGGIVGEDGINNIELGHTYPGNIYREIQKTIKQYSNQGVILALNSKNNLEDVKEVFDNHRDCVLKWDDFAAIRANWENKVKNLREIAEEINIGIESLVFVDDNPFEVEMIKQAYPEVETVNFSKNVLNNLALIMNLDSFHNIYFSTSDLDKKKQYQDQSKRKRLKASVVNIEEFYEGLQMEVNIKLCDEYALTRVAQLTQKTNQFNLTTRRYSKSDIETFINSEYYRVYYLSLKDRFGDNGITGAMIIIEEGKDWLIDTFLLSCRIIGRTAETAFLAFILDEAKQNNVKRLIGEYISSKKNSLVKNIYQDNGFIKENNKWILDTSKNIQFPKWIKIS